MSQPRRIWWHPAEGSLFLPDLTPGDASLKQSVVEDTIAFAKRLPLPEVGFRALAEIALNFIMVAIIRSIFQRLADRATKALDETEAKHQSVLVLVLATAVKAASKPIALLLPLNAAFASLRVAVLALQIVADRGHPFLQNNRILGHSLHQFLHVCVGVDHIFLSLSSIVIILFTCWFCLSWKESLLEIVSDIERDLEETHRPAFSIERIAVPVSGLAGWGIVIVGVLTSMHVLGINIQPLLTVGGVGGVAIGFGAQTVTANIVSGINLFLTRPFVVGDRVELKTAGGGSVLAGQVESIEPMRTVIDAAGIPVAIPNKAILDMLICNESKLQRSPVPMAAVQRTSRRYSTKVSLRYEDISKIPAICAEVTAWLKQHEGVDTSLSLYTELASLGEWSATMSVLAHITATQARSYSAFNTEVLMKVAETVDRHGAQFARMGLAPSH